MALEIFKILGTIAVSNTDANAALDETTTKAEATQQAINSIRTGAIKVGTAFTGLAGVLGGAFYSSVENTREYREQMNMLSTAFESSGHSVESARQTYSELNAVLGDTGQAVEAANHIAKLVSNTKDMKTWTDICAGVWATFGESLPLEGLTEAANETAKVGQVVGPLADALNWMGVSEDAFNEKLKGMSSEQERQQLIMETLNGAYKDASELYKENNKDIMAAYKAQDKMTAAVANYGAVGEPILTAMQSKLVDIVNGSFTWIMNNGEAVGAGLSVIAAGIAAGAIAAHPWAAALTAAAAAITWFISESQGLATGANYDKFFDKYSDEELQTLQAYVDSVNDARAAEEAYANSGFDDAVGKAWEDALAKQQVAFDAANAIDGLIADYNAWRSGQAVNQGKDLYLDVPLKVKDGAEKAIQSDINGMSLEGVVKLYADTSALPDSIYNIASTGKVDGSHASGLWRVPRDGYIAELHADEAVLNRTDAKVWRSERTQNAGSSNAELASMIAAAVRGAVAEIGFNVSLDGNVLVGQLIPRIDEQLGKIANRRGR